MSKNQSTLPLLQAALNGDRVHPAAPRTPGDIAAQARTAVGAGARSLHLHPYGEDGKQTFAAEPCATTLRAVRAACPGIPISLSTSADVEPDPQRRISLIEKWTVLPDLVTANQGEDGIGELCELLVARGIGIEAGLLCLDDAYRFVAAGIAPHCVRVMVEPLDADPAAAVAHAEAIEGVLAAAGVVLEQVHHGDGVASWAVNVRAVPLKHGIRTGLEDTPVLPDGRIAEDNGDLVAAAARILAQHKRPDR
ncbi:3-keto-5-aminohexanoate cleavage protein [Amycolatopsis sp. H20-H5]|uniref:3-keto-5-aminohexanoate cleavage protein n=1 Tax=Amycolatopsis sp. H20-H5 TaxID=3046309 RepID=UPI002DB74B38|nr:3-keto-5-aminohexanoate cleavage protein [Amycolatopsis sp. H20-H5]MEC3974987.1 3-keto-5-aminohexanoate cleavage protein [Amycolatopsis sp. H20-H5]